MKLLNKLKSDRQDLISNLLDNIESLEKLAFEQQAENERLKISFDAQASLIEKKNLAYDRICVKHRNEINTAKSEAIKEFVKKFEKKIKDVKFTLGQTWEIQNALKDTLKEMVGDDNGENRAV
jgi:hypothetical protein